LRRGTRVSSIFGYSTITTKGQAKLSLNANYWTPQNKFHYTGVISYYNYPFNFYGIGNNTRLAALDHVSEKRYKFGITGEKLFGDYFYLGYVAGVFKYFYRYDPNLKATINADPAVQDKHGGANIYIGPSFTFDTRNNNTYTTSGMIISSYSNIMHGAYANNSYKGGFFNIEYSQFFSLARKLVLGLDIQEQSLTGTRSPFYLLPQLGSDEMMRGYYGGRYRDRNYIAGQAELRYRVDNRFGIVAFAGTGEVFHSTFSTSQLKPDYGGGVRYFFDVEKGLAIRLDYGVGQKPAGEKRESGFYIALGQSF
ncbi:MAG: polymerase, partial [Mucilaginibacter sp.]